MDDKVWRLTVFLADGRKMTVALYKDEGEALTDALLLAEDERVLGYRIEPVKWEVVAKNEKIQIRRVDGW
ncbi:transporter [Escherichia coli]|nr:transporter [Escherichia coli]ELT3623518.1 transporter [Escherichia coli]ELT3780517.1 transporter [Escherichia coli]